MGGVCEIEPAYVNEREAVFMRTCERPRPYVFVFVQLSAVGNLNF